MKNVHLLQCHEVVSHLIQTHASPAPTTSFPICCCELGKFQEEGRPLGLPGMHWRAIVCSVPRITGTPKRLGQAAAGMKLRRPAFGGPLSRMLESALLSPPTLAYRSQIVHQPPYLHGLPHRQQLRRERHRLVRGWFRQRFILPCACLIALITHCSAIHSLCPSQTPSQTLAVATMTVLLFIPSIKFWIDSNYLRRDTARASHPVPVS